MNDTASMTAPNTIATPLKDITAYVPVDDRLATSGQPTVVQFKDIAAAGFLTVINLGLPTSTGALSDEQQTVESNGMEYIAIPVPFEAPAREHYFRFETELRARRDRRVWVHCAMNYRVTSFLAVYRMRVLGWSRRDAFASVNKVWEPDQVWARWTDDCLNATNETSAPSTPLPTA